MSLKNSTNSTQVPASSQTKRLERGWKQRVRLERDVKDVFYLSPHTLRARKTLTTLFTDFVTDFEKKKQRFCSLGFTPYKYIIQKQKIHLEKHARMCVCLCVCGGGRG